MRTGDKADLTVLSEYVSTHPDEYERRWSLAKKLYMAWEYNDALKHLLVLKKNWSRKQNVLRYLAATYFRLGHYDEAIAELQAVAELWPNDVAVWEQLARVFEVAGRAADAAHVWEQILRISPSHPSAARSVQRLRSPSRDAPRENLRLRDSDSGIDMGPYRICQNCGAQNSDEFERCWQCHAALRDDGAPIDSVHTARAPKSRAWLLTLVGGMATVCAVSASLYVTLLAFRRINLGAPSSYGLVYDTLAENLLIPRLACAAALVVAWPVGMWCALRLSGARHVPWPSLFGVGLLLSSSTYLGMWAPVPWLPYAPALPALLSFIAILSFRAANVPQSIAAWILHGAFLLLAGAGSFAMLAGLQPIVQFPEIISYNSSRSALATPESLLIFSASGNGGCFVQWRSTNSSWLDEHGGNIVIEAVPEDPGITVTMDLTAGETSVSQPGTAANSISVQVLPNTTYTLRASGPDGSQYLVRSRGVLQPSIEGKLMD